MDPRIGWALAAAALGAGWLGYGWRGIVLALTVVAFWLLLQFSRTLRVLRAAAQRPVGQVDSAVMLHSKLQTGMRLADVIKLAGSLGRKVGDAPQRFAWSDAGHVEVVVDFGRDGCCTGWTIMRPQ